MAKIKKIAIGCSLLALTVGVVFWFSPAGDAVRDILKSGFLDNSEPTYENFKGDSSARLKALHTATMSYHQSEESFPKAEKWMDDLLPRLKTSDLKLGEAQKKLIRPDLEGQSGKFGYALNNKVAGKYRGDFKDGNTILFFESVETNRSAVGDPAKDAKPGAKAITLDGKEIVLN
jgi:hypothetical protein